MIVIDTSALIAIIAKESGAAQCVAKLEYSSDVMISAGTLVEALVVAARRNATGALNGLIDQISPEVVPVTESMARAAGQAYREWGKTFHPASLNFGDCFAYALAKEYDCPLLYVGNDFAQTDIKAAL